MIDFKESFNIGMAAATQAEENHAEVQRIFDALNRDLGEITNGLVQFDICEFEEETGPLSIKLFDRTYDAVAVRNPKAGSSWLELAKWEQDSSGYPCKIHLPQGIKYCEDQDAVSSALSSLIAEVDVAKKIRRLMAMSGDK